MGEEMCNKRTRHRDRAATNHPVLNHLLSKCFPEGIQALPVLLTIRICGLLPFLGLTYVIFMGNYTI